ncbi:ATP-binding cassette domain-containing protein [Streptomyces sp. TP-A0874]|uniref:ATP-binding cassette domain-containing protein n=1 Tax=Streptomyces sp. TP-A0874 TaxID=549819 RepID=UPI00099F5B97|nr:ABC transporter ATP-binding protein [Streptomyces sp. TP-A0874]
MPGTAVTTEHTAEALAGGPAPAASALRLLREGLRGSRRPMLHVGLWSVAEAAPAMAAGTVVAIALDRGFLAGDIGTGLGWLALLAVLYLLRALAERAVFDPLAEIVEPLRDALVRRVVRGTLHHAVYRTRPVDASGVSRLSTQTDTVRGIVAALLRTARPLAATLVAASVGMAALDPLLAVIVVPPLVLAVVLFALAMRTLIRRRLSAVMAEERVAAATGAVLTAGRDITALGAEEAAHDDVEQAAAQAARASVAISWADALRLPVLLLGGYVPILVLLLTGPALVERGTVSAGAVVGAVLCLTTYLVPALQLMTGAVAGYWSQLRVVLGRLAQATEVAGEVRENRSGTLPAERGGEERSGVAGGDLIVRGLTFRYGPHAAPVLSDLTVTVPAGDHLAVVGPSGVGKSTLAGLLVGVEQPQHGAVLLGGRPVRAFGDDERRAVMALLPQEAYVVPGTLRENLSYLAPGLTDDELHRGVEAVGMTDLVHRIGGYDVPIPDPTTALSGGERQLVALARVFLSPARTVILDEATCHLDPVTEARAEAAFALRPGTLVVIAHRLTSAARARRVLLLDGDDVALGTHDELLARNAAYADLVGHWTGTAG